MLARNLLLAGALGAMALLGTGAAFASPGVATAAVNVRSGPGVGYAVVGGLQPGEGVDIQQCQAGWCEIAYDGPGGWASASYLSGAGYSGPVYEPAPVYVPSPPVYYGNGGYPPPFHHQHHYVPGNGNPPHGVGTPPHRPPPQHVHTSHMRPPHVGGAKPNFCAVNPSACDHKHP